jgi:opacity protein-like surface antigen
LQIPASWGRVFAGRPRERGISRFFPERDEVKRLLLVPILAVLLPAEASAQVAPERVRFEWLTGFLVQGTVGTASFSADLSGFQNGQLVERDEGIVDVDPAFWNGIGATYRLNSRFIVGASWMHSAARYRVQFPAQASDPGNFDLEGYLLASADWTSLFQGGDPPERAMSDAVTDAFLLSGTVEIPLQSRRVFPYAKLGLGVFRQSSQGTVFDMVYGSNPPLFVRQLEAAGLTVEEDAFGVPLFQVRETNALVSLGAGVRVSVTDRWAVGVHLEDLVRINPDLSEFEVSSREPDVEAGRVFSTTLSPVSGSVHNFGVRLSASYSLWPLGVPR